MPALRRAAAACSLFAAFSGTARAQTYDFTGATPGTPTPLSITSGGVTATFASTPAGVYEVSNAARLGVGFSTLTGNFLINPAGPPAPLTVGFSTLLSAVSFTFATAGGGGVLAFQAFQGATLVGSTTFTSTMPSGFFNGEGVGSFSGASFDRVVLSNSTTVIAIDDVTVRAAASAVPEPATVVLLGVGLATVALAGRRRRSGA